MPRPTLPPGHVFHSFHNFLLDSARKTCNIDIIYQEKYSFRSILPSYAAYNASWWTVFRPGPEAFAGMALYPASAWKIPYSARLCLHTFLAFPLLSFLASHNFHLAQGSSFSCITAPVAVHTAVSLYSWSHANINALPRNGRYSLPDSTGILTSYCWLLMASWPIII